MLPWWIGLLLFVSVALNVILALALISRTRRLC
jgi:hypothetical protein